MSDDDINDYSFDQCVNELNKVFDGGYDQLKTILLSSDSFECRSLLRLFERFIQLDWQKSRFERISHPIVLQICSAIFSISDEIKFCADKVWFGGISRVHAFSLVCSSPSCSNHNSSQSTANAASTDDILQRRLNSLNYFSIGIMLLALVDKIEEIASIKQINLFLRQLESLFANSALSFVDSLLENDERCLRTLTGCLKLHSRSRSYLLPKMLDPGILFLVLLHKLQFDTLVFIDWASSEPELNYVFLKNYSQFLMSFTKQRVFELCNNFCQIPKSNEVKYDIVHAEPDSPSSDAYFHFEIEELHGKQEIFKRVTVPTKSNNSFCQRHDDKLPMPDSMLSSLTSFCTNLELKLSKLAASLHFPAKTICQNLRAIESELISENNHCECD